MPTDKGFRRAALFGAAFALAASAFLGGTMADRTMREPLVLLTFVVMLASFVGVLVLSEMDRGVR